MTQPTTYVRVFDFTSYQAASPSVPLPGPQVDAEYNAIKSTLDQICNNLAIIQRDDTLLGNAIVHPDSLTLATQMMIAGWNPRGNWLTATAYAVKDLVVQSNISYVCLVAHTAGVFATDLAAGKWQSVFAGAAAGAILQNGSSPPTANIPFAGFKITNLGDGTAQQDAVTIKQAQANTLEWGGASSGAAGTFNVTLTPAPAQYTAGMVVRFQAHQAGSGASDQINVNSLGNKPLKKLGGTSLAAADIPNGAIVEAELDKDLTNFQVLSIVGNLAVINAANTFTAAQVISTAGTTLAQLITTLAGAGVGPVMELQRNIASAANNILGSLDYTGLSATSVARTFARINGKVITATNAAKDGQINFQTIRGGAVANRLNIGAGIFTPSATGGDKGTDSLNVGALYVNGASVTPGASIAGQSLVALTPLGNEPPSANYAQLGFSNGHPTLDFDTTTQETAIFTGVMPQRYSNATGITVYITAIMASATSGTLGWTIELERCDPATNLTSDSFASAQIVTATTVPGTAGLPLILSKAITSGANMDNIVAGDTFRIRIKRDVANDNAAGDARLISIEIRET